MGSQLAPLGTAQNGPLSPCDDQTQACTVQARRCAQTVSGSAHQIPEQQVGLPRKPAASRAEGDSEGLKEAGQPGPSSDRQRETAGPAFS